MSRYYSDLDNTYYTSRQQSDNVRASGWQSPLPTTNVTYSSPLLRIAVECPFGSKKCDYTIDKSQLGRLIVAARRRHTFKSAYLSLNPKDNIITQTFTIPFDVDVERLQSHIERVTNRLIIEIPRTQSSYINTRNTYNNLIHSPDILTSPIDDDDPKYIRKNLNNNQKLEYRIDCRGYTSDELDVFIQGRDLIVQGKTKRAISSDPTQQHISKHLSRKIPLPNTVDLSKIVSYFEDGELRIEAKFKSGMYYNDRKIYLPEGTPIAVSNRTGGQLNRIQSPVPSTHQHHYRRRQRVSRHRAYDHGDDPRPSSPMQRARSADSFLYPSTRLSRDFDDEDEDEDDARQNQTRRTVNYQRYITNRNDTDQQPVYRSVYSPTNNVFTTRTAYRN